MFGYDDRLNEGEPLGVSGLPAGGLLVALNRGYKRYAVTIIYPYLFPRRILKDWRDWQLTSARRTARMNFWGSNPSCRPRLFPFWKTPGAFTSWAENVKSVKFCRI